MPPPPLAGPMLSHSKITSPMLDYPCWTFPVSNNGSVANIYMITCIVSSQQHIVLIEKDNIGPHALVDRIIAMRIDRLM